MLKNFIKYDGSDECKSNIQSLVNRLNDKYKGERTFRCVFIDKQKGGSRDVFGVSSFAVDEDDDNCRQCSAPMRNYVYFDTKTESLSTCCEEYYYEIIKEQKDL